MPKGIALVTGASRGIGFETARDLIKRGWRVAITARGAEALATAAEKLGSEHVLAVPCDTADHKSVADAVAKVTAELGPIEALINNAGVIDPVGRMHKTDPGDWAKLQLINIAGVYNTCRAVVPGMLERGRGVIVNLSSGAAHNVVDGWSAYCTSKAALAMFTRCLHEEYGDGGVRVHGFVPGAVGTSMLLGAQKKHDNAVARLAPETLLSPDLPGRCIGWIVDEGVECKSGEELTIRDPELRQKVGLEERAQW